MIARYQTLVQRIQLEFVPRFAPRAKLMYLKGTKNVAPIVDKSVLKRFGFSLENQSIWPDVIFYVPRKRWIYLVDVAAANGPVSFPRRQELEAMFANKTARCVYISAFLDFEEYKRHGFGIAWDTEVWIAEAPDHLIHFNGEKFLGPRRSSRSRTKQ